jgi:hypothetical protein
MVKLVMINAPAFPVPAGPQRLARQRHRPRRRLFGLPPLSDDRDETIAALADQWETLIRRRVWRWFERFPYRATHEELCAAAVVAVWDAHVWIGQNGLTPGPAIFRRFIDRGLYQYLAHAGVIKGRRGMIDTRMRPLRHTPAAPEDRTADILDGRAMVERLDADLTPKLAGAVRARFDLPGGTLANNENTDRGRYMRAMAQLREKYSEQG